MEDVSSGKDGLWQVEKHGVFFLLFLALKDGVALRIVR